MNELSDLPGVNELKAAGLLDTRPVRTIFGEAGQTGLDKDEEDQTGEPEPVEALDPTDGEGVNHADSEAVDHADSEAVDRSGGDSIENRMAG